MQEIGKLINEYGVSLVIVILFLYDWLTTRRNMQKTIEQNGKCLIEIQNTNMNTAKSLELLQKSMDNQSEFLQVHDRRCEAIEKDIEKIEIKMEG
ncbi:MAG TPA: hypothetical protein OIM61_07930 [Clostridiaceae bacterium]|jgi:hypothetical protein|uniref:Uncharacterized protein n=1 Tax=Siphoviridae sp. ctiJI15 TaxID=2826431 RepID=A0A8S5NKS8_9CAUD|nr:MAG TPA: hypothetical protein [Siphoviridae sp. ctiJI15]DAZ79053.1 MAG TPA: hypothetical protein [Caudoviricetes sp.]HJJ19153.1 hypothetical protein [Clostridiaceae bacterium]